MLYNDKMPLERGASKSIADIHKDKQRYTQGQAAIHTRTSSDTHKDKQRYTQGQEAIHTRTPTH